MSRLQDLHGEHGQSPWLDNLRRGWLHGGEMQQWIERGVRGLTSNPSIFAMAMTSTDEYDTDLRRLVDAGSSINDAYWDLVAADIEAATGLLRPVFESSSGEDGFVSVEVSPTLAHDTDATVAAARELSGRLRSPNLFIKVPATIEGIPAIETLIGEGISVNVTLIFGLERYDSVMDAYLRGLETYAAAHPDTDLGSISSVASFFVSRVDTEVDRRLEDIGTPAALDLRGKAAIANAKIAYQRFLATFSGSRWESLRARGARLQRPLWASTSTKNPAYPDTMYVDSLIGPDTVNTLPDGTLEAFEDHGTLRRTIDTGVAEAEEVAADLLDVGVDLAEVAAKLESEGVGSFAKSFDEALETLAGRADEVR